MTSREEAVVAATEKLLEDVEAYASTLTLAEVLCVARGGCRGFSRMLDSGVPALRSPLTVANGGRVFAAIQSRLIARAIEIAGAPDDPVAVCRDFDAVSYPRMEAINAAWASS